MGPKCGNLGCERGILDGPSLHQYVSAPVPVKAPEWARFPAHAGEAESGLYCSKACLIKDISREE